MPELPEVEVTRLGMAPRLSGQKVLAVDVRDHRLRWPVPSQLGHVLPGHRVNDVGRRAKYLLLEFGHGTLVIHLGMSGSLQLLTRQILPGKHDHVDLVLEGGAVLRYNDPRRFGAFLWLSGDHPDPFVKSLLDNQGVEPLGSDLTGDWLWEQVGTRQVAVKPMLLTGKEVAGVGNIYASESLFRAGIHPFRPCARISRRRYGCLVQSIREVLDEAIGQGGSTLRDFVDSAGRSGYFQNAHRVYGREGQPCLQCGTPIRMLKQGQRSTWYCVRCQR